MEEECCSDFGTRGEEDEEEELNLTISEEEFFGKNYRKLNIKAETLPQYESKSLVYLNQKPGFVVAWLQSYLREQLINK
jgi:hypothetical protein